MAQHAPDPLTTDRPRDGEPGRGTDPRRGGGRGGGRGRRRADQAVRLLYAATYLMNSPGTRQLLMWGGPEARDLLGHTVELVTEQQRLAAAAATWRSAAADLHHAAGELTGQLDRVAGWESAAARAFRAEHHSRAGQLTALAETYHTVAGTLDDAADEAGRLHAALLATTHAAGESVRLLADGMSPAGAAHAVIAAWTAGSQALLHAWTARSDHAAATLAALSPAALSPAGDVGGVTGAGGTGADTLAR